MTHVELDLPMLCKLQPFVSATRPHGKATYQLLFGADRRLERHYAHIAGEWRHPAVGEDDKAMDVITEQHQTHRSWMMLTSDLPDDYFTSNPLYQC
jgi:hypothetical protein